MRLRTGAAVIGATPLPRFEAPVADTAARPGATWKFNRGSKADVGTR
ncbi:hypothetical protein ABZ871_32385 [Streptomyces populi]